MKFKVLIAAVILGLALPVAAQFRQIQEAHEVQLSDLLLLEEMQRRLKVSGYRFNEAVETIVTSPQFRKIRGRLVENEG